MKKKKTRITLNIYQDDFETIQKFLKDKETNQTDLLRDIIRDWCLWYKSIE